VDGGGSAREVCLSEDDGAGVILGEDGIDGDVEVSRVATGASSEEEGWRDVDVEDVFEGRAVAFNRASVAYETGSAGRKEGGRQPVNTAHRPKPTSAFLPSSSLTHASSWAQVPVQPLGHPQLSLQNFLCQNDSLALPADC
jgi:hypothetical protein